MIVLKVSEKERKLAEFDAQIKDSGFSLDDAVSKLDAKNEDSNTEQANSVDFFEDAWGTGKPIEIGVKVGLHTKEESDAPIIWVSPEEYAKISHQIETYPKKKIRVLVFTANNFYLCDVKGAGYFRVLMEMPIEGNEEFINSLYNEAGKLSVYETSESVGDIVAQLERAEGSLDRNNADFEGRYASTEGLDSMVVSQSSDRGRDNGETNQGGRSTSNNAAMTSP